MQSIHDINFYLDKLKDEIIKKNSSLLYLLDNLYFETEELKGPNNLTNKIIFTLKRGDETEGVVELNKINCVRTILSVSIFAIHRIVSKNNNPKIKAILLACVLPYLLNIGTQIALILNWDYDDETYDVFNTFGFQTSYLNNKNKSTNFCNGKDGKLGLFLHQSFVYKNPDKNKYYKSTSEIYDSAYRVLAAAVEDASAVSILSSLRDAKGGKKLKRKTINRRRRRRKTRKTY